MEQLEIDDLLYQYPKLEDISMQSYITHQKEFIDLKSTSQEELPQRGNFFKHQLLIQRLLYLLDRLFIISETGTGKTCSVIGATEKYKKAFFQTLDYLVDQKNIYTYNNESTISDNYLTSSKNHYRHVYILVKGETTENEFRNQIICHCTPPEEYEFNPSVIASKKVKSRESNLTKLLKQYYTILTYGNFVSRFVKKGEQLNDATLIRDIEREYNDCIYIVDEAHNIGIDNYSIGEAKRSKEKNYEIIHRIFHLVKRSKIILMTATPAINSPNLIFSLTNLLLPMDRQMDINLDPESLTEEYLTPYFRNMISYVRSFDTGVDLEYQGIQVKYNHLVLGKLIPSQQIVYPVMMPSYQKEMYLKFTGASNDIYRKQRQVAIVAYYNGLVGSKAYNQYFKNYTLSHLIETKPPQSGDVDIREQMSLSNLQECFSGKFYHIIKIVEVSIGTCYIYFDFKESGIIPLALAFMQEGYELFDPQTLVFTSTSQDETILPPLCTTEMDKRKIVIEKKKRIALFVPENGDKNNRNILDLYNTPENKDGDYLKVFITSPIGREAINTRNTRTFILGQPLWNQATTYQALSRSIRAGSHDDLLIPLRRQALKEGKDPSQVRIKVKVYQLASFLEPNDYDLSHKDGTWAQTRRIGFQEGEIREGEEVGEESLQGRQVENIDMYMYMLSENKDIYNKYVLRIMKKLAIDCWINHDKNIRKGDIDGSSVCDYQLCQYDCHAPNLENIDHLDMDVYNTLYVPDDAIQIIDKIIYLFHMVFVIPFSKMMEILQLKDSKILLMALMIIIKEKLSIVNRFGVISYLGFDNELIFLTTSYSNLSYNLSYYNQELFGIDEQFFFNYHPPHKIEVEESYLLELGTLSDQPYQFNLTFQKLSRERKILLFEEALSYLLNSRKGNEIFDLLLSIYHRFYFTIQYQNYSTIIHILDNIITDIENYNLSDRAFNIRYDKITLRRYSPIDKKWVDVPKIEAESLVKQVEHLYRQPITQLEQYLEDQKLPLIYGLKKLYISPMPKEFSFKIIDKSNIKKIEDRRTISRGMEVISKPIKEIKIIFEKVGAPLEPDITQFIGIGKKYHLEDLGLSLGPKEERDRILEEHHQLYLKLTQENRTRRDLTREYYSKQLELYMILEKRMIEI